MEIRRFEIDGPIEYQEDGGLVLYTDHLDAVEALNKRIEESEADRRWIMVEERLPEADHTDVIVVRNGKVETLRFAYGHFYDFGYEQGGVTHWQPLPRAPQ